MDHYNQMHYHVELDRLATAGILLTSFTAVLSGVFVRYESDTKTQVGHV